MLPLVACGGAGDHHRRGTPASGVLTSASGPTDLARQRGPGAVIGDVAVGGDHLDWTVHFDDVPDVEIHDLDLRTGRRVLLGRASMPLHGLAATSGWVAYPEQKGRSVLLVARRHASSEPVVLSSHLTGRIAGRGERVAWAEVSGGRQKLIVRDMRTGAERVAAVLPRCARGRCYRIDDVELSARGVAFTRGALGPYPSQVVRRAFATRRTRVLSVPDDPQPDLLPSSSGPLVSIAGRGLVRWDFGTARSRPVALRWLGSHDVVLGRVRGLWVVLRSDGRRPRIHVRRPGGSEVVAAVPRLDVRRQTATLGSWTWARRRVFALWLLQERGSGDATEEGPAATVIQAGRRLP